MEPFDNEELSDRELNGILREWQAPPTPTRLGKCIFAERHKPWWRRIWTTSIRVPVPVAACLVLLFLLSVRQRQAPAPPRVVVKTERVEIPVVTERVVTKLVYRERPAATFYGLQPVAELRPRIIRSGNAPN